MKTDIKMTLTSDALRTEAAGLLDGIGAEPVPPEMLELALVLQAKFAERDGLASPLANDQAPDAG